MSLRVEDDQALCKQSNYTGSNVESRQGATGLSKIKSETSVTDWQRQLSATQVPKQWRCHLMAKMMAVQVKVFRRGVTGLFLDLRLKIGNRHR